MDSAAPRQRLTADRRGPDVFVDGRNIVDYAEQEKLSVRDRVQLFLKACGAVEYAHRNLIAHGDLQPANVLVGSDGAPRLVNFGIAQRLNPAVPLRLEWASPEQIRGESVTTATDVYSLGAVLYQVLSGEAPPVSSPGYTRQRRAGLDSIIQKALRPNPAERYPSVTHLIADLRHYLAGEAIEARDYSPVERIAIAARRHRIPAAAAAVALFSLVSGAAMSLGYAVHARAELAIAVADRARAEAERERAQLHSDEAARLQKFAESKETDAQFQRAAAEEQRLIAERTLHSERRARELQALQPPVVIQAQTAAVNPNAAGAK